MKEYKFIGETEQFVPRIGIVKPGQTIKTEEEINNVLFERITEKKETHTNSKTK